MSQHQKAVEAALRQHMAVEAAWRLSYAKGWADCMQAITNAAIDAGRPRQYSLCLWSAAELEESA